MDQNHHPYKGHHSRRKPTDGWDISRIKSKIISTPFDTSIKKIICLKSKNIYIFTFSCSTTFERDTSKKRKDQKNIAQAYVNQWKHLYLIPENNEDGEINSDEEAMGITSNNKIQPKFIRRPHCNIQTMSIHSRFECAHINHKKLLHQYWSRKKSKPRPYSSHSRTKLKKKREKTHKPQILHTSKSFHPKNEDVFILRQGRVNVSL